ncbi:MAG TPA: A/G-specific adenine glycosylase [Parafilimonas sp.]|nr:A/G-specific adenine glycosylase [Parafilimonas sp.]
MVKAQKIFTRTLLDWNRLQNTRAMPWKGEKDPYRVWLSEVILQQTRVEQGWSYYEKFIAKYPSIEKLAAAKDEQVFKLWEGLGYYSRCRNLLHTARMITDKYHGKFPADRDDMMRLKGIGSYTASAIASFCFDLPYAVVDGNVLRVIARFFGIQTPIDTSEGKKFFSSLAQACLDKVQPGPYNQAIMDFGATICKPLPLCDACMLRKNCRAIKLKKVSDLPAKSSRLQKKTRWFSYFVFIADQRMFVHERNAKDIWQHLYEFHLVETAADPEWTSRKVKAWLKKNLAIDSIVSIRIIRALTQALTHQMINGYFIETELHSVPASLQGNGSWMTKKLIGRKPFPRFIHQYLSEKKSGQ